MELGCIVATMNSAAQYARLKYGTTLPSGYHPIHGIVHNTGHAPIVLYTYQISISRENKRDTHTNKNMLVIKAVTKSCTIRIR